MVVRFCETQLIVHCHKHDELHAAHNETNDLDIPDVPPVGVKQNVSEISQPLQRPECPSKEKHFLVLWLPDYRARIKKVLSEGSKFNGFFVIESREDPNTTKSGPSSAHQRNAI